MTIQLNNASIFQAGKSVLTDVNFILNTGDLAFLIGKTGAGKSSLLKTLYGQLPLQQGEGVVLGHDLTNLSEDHIPILRRKLGVIFQDFNLLNDRTVFENLNWVLKATGWGKRKKRKERIHEVLSLVGIEEHVQKMPFAISGGEQQRLVIARAILNNPKIIIADEPTGNLDPDTADLIMQLLQDLRAQTGATILIATHDYRIVEKQEAIVFKCEEKTLKVIHQQLMSRSQG